MVEKKNGLLKKISTNAEDRSEKIAETLIRTVFTGISQNPGFSESLLQAGRAQLPARLSNAKQFEAEYDPFDPDQTAVVNDALKELGFCLLLEEQNLNYEAYCSNPLRHTTRERLINRTSVRNAEPHPVISQSCRVEDVDHDGWRTRTSHLDRGGGPQCRLASHEPAVNLTRTVKRDRPREYSQGIFYRARLPYNYYLYIRPNMKVMGNWKLRGTAVVHLENRSPVFSVAVDRTFFATRQTALDFDDGVLQDVTISKGSELAGFVSIPLLIAQSIAALPANIIQIRIDQTNNRGKLIAAQTALIEQQERELAMRLRLQEAEDRARKAGVNPKLPRALRADTDLADDTGRGLPIDEQGRRPGTIAGLPSMTTKTFHGCMDGCGDYEHVCRKHCSCVMGCIEKPNQENACRQACPEARGR